MQQVTLDIRLQSQNEVNRMELGEAPMAVNYAIAFINPKTRLQPFHSTSIFG